MFTTDIADNAAAAREDIARLEGNVNTLKTRVSELEDELLVKTSLIRDLVGSLTSLRDLATRALEA